MRTGVALEVREPRAKALWKDVLAGATNNISTTVTLLTADDNYDDDDDDDDDNNNNNDDDDNNYDDNDCVHVMKILTMMHCSHNADLAHWKNLTKVGPLMSTQRSAIRHHTSWIPGATSPTTYTVGYTSSNCQTLHEDRMQQQQ